jgi:hypothetical protein
LIGESIVTPSGKAIVRLGTDEKKPEHRLAVYVTPADDQNLSTAPDSSSPVEEPKAEKEPALVLGIQEDGHLQIYADTTLHGKLTISGGAAEFGAIELQAVNSPTANQKWKDISFPGSIYRVTNLNVKQSTDTGDPNKEAQDKFDQLRIEMGAGSSGKNQVVVGFWSEDDKQFKECLTIEKADNECNVIIHGNLIVEGQTVGLSSVTTVPPGEDVKGFLVSSSLVGIGGVPAMLQFFDRIKSTSGFGNLLAPFARPMFVNLREMFKGNDEQFRAFLDVLSEDEEMRRSMQDVLKKKPDVDR